MARIRPSGRDWLLSLCLMSVALWGCTRRSGMDWSYLTRTECRPPCWEEITPGQTTSNEAVSLLASKEREGRGELISHEEDGYLIWVDTRKVSVTLHIRAGLVSMVSFPVSSTSLGELLELYDEPAGFLVLLGTDTRSGSIEILYPERGLVFYAEGRRHDNQLTVSASSQVVRAVLVAPGGMEEVARAVDGQEELEQQRPRIRDWSGYGQVYP